jgi:hypothetical protein
MNQAASNQTLSDTIAVKAQQKTHTYTDPNTGESKVGPRFLLRGFKHLKPGQTEPEKIYFDGNKTFDAVSKQFKVQTVAHALFIKARMMKNYASELKIYDNDAQPDEQLIYHYIVGLYEKKDLLELYLTFKKI